MISGTATSVTYYAYDRTTSQAKTGDAANHTIRVVHDGTEITPAGSPAEIDATNMPGWYKVTLTGAENTGGFMLVGGKSSTANINIQGQTWVNESSAPVWTSLTINGPVRITTTTGGNDAVQISTTGDGSAAVKLRAAGSAADGLDIISTGSSGRGLFIQGNAANFILATNGDGLKIESSENGGNGISLFGGPSGGKGAFILGDITGALVQANQPGGAALQLINNSGSGDGMSVSTVAGAGINLLGVNGGEPLAYRVVDVTSNPGANATFDRRFAWMSNLAQFKLDESATQQQVYAADGVTVIGTAPVSDLAGVTTRDTYV